MRFPATRQPARLRLLPVLVPGLLVLGGAASPARAADCAPPSGLSTCIDADNLWIRAGGGPFFSLAGAATAPSGKASFGLVLSYQSRPLGLQVPGPSAEGTTIYVLDNMLDATFVSSLGLSDRLEVTLAAPVTLYQDGAGLAGVQNTEQELPRSVVRDPRLGIAYAILAPRRVGPPDGFALAARFELALPTGDKGNFAGAPTATAAPSLSADYRIGIVGIAAEAGGRFRGASTFAGAEIGSNLYGALGASVDVLADRWLTVGAEAFALAPLSGQQAAPTPSEWIASVSSAPLLAGDVVFSLGGGGAIPLTAEPAVTAPRFRVNLGVRYAPTGRDTDGDTVLDRDDHCATIPEDRDGFEDGDGCPDPDNDGDRVPDARDRCRDAAETADGFKDADGCPDPDDDEDGVEDAADRCRNEAEDRDQFEDGDGCPDPDNDGDRILDKADTCPNGAEDRDGVKDEDGCPDPDNDLDLVLDAADACPDAREDRDGFEDDDGCPEPDNDEDGVLDAKDACPRAPEIIDGKVDEDGCPEPGARSRGRWTGDLVVVENLPRFTPASARMPPDLEAGLRMAAQMIRGRLPVESIIIEAYPDRAGDGSDRALALAAARADAVKALLVAAGIPADSITAAAGDTSARRAPNAPQVDITVMRARRPAVRPPAAPGTPSASPATAPTTPTPPAEDPSR